MHYWVESTHLHTYTPYVTQQYPDESSLKYVSKSRNFKGVIKIEKVSLGECVEKKGAS